jgi:hypothetical protein
LLQVGIAVHPSSQHILGATNTLSVSGSKETAGMSSSSMIRVEGLRDIRGWRGRGEGEMRVLCGLRGESDSRGHIRHVATHERTQ